jgi:hypothetical protein
LYSERVFWVLVTGAFLCPALKSISKGIDGKDEGLDIAFIKDDEYCQYSSLFGVVQRVCFKGSKNPWE